MSLIDNNANARNSEASIPQIKPLPEFRWLHVPTSSFDAREEFGTYKYRVTPRYMTNDKLAPLDTNLTVEIEMEVEPFRKGKLKIGFTRGFMISQAYSRRFGNDTSIRPKNDELLFDISDTSGTYPEELKFVGGKKYSYKDQYEWMGWQAHDLLFNTLAEMKNDAAITVDIFAYVSMGPICQKLLELAAVGRIRMIWTMAVHMSPLTERLARGCFEEKFRVQQPRMLESSRKIPPGTSKPYY
jgi:hypothetical protein